MNNEVLLTQRGYDELVSELEYLKTEKRREIAEKIKVARGYGDLSENSEYDEAKNEQGLVESKIAELEAKLKLARVIDHETLEKDVVSVGTRVVIRYEDGEEETYDIVGSTEYDPFNGKISDDSPMGAGLKGHRTGEVVSIELPGRKTIHVTIKHVEIHR